MGSAAGEQETGCRLACYPELPLSWNRTGRDAYTFLINSVPSGSLAGGPEECVSKQRTSRLERREERAAKQPNSTPPARRQRTKPQARNVDAGPKFLPPFLRNVSATTLGIAAIGIVVLGFMVYAVTQTGQAAKDPGWVTAQLDDDPNLPGTYVAPHPGPDGTANTTDDRQHYRAGSLTIPICSDAQLASGNISDPLCYASNPPTSGPHSDQPMPFKVLENPAPKENLVHNMEHGGIVIWYNTSNSDAIKKLQDFTNEQIDRRRFVVMTQYSGMEADTIAVTSWTRIEKVAVSELDIGFIEDFISEHHKRFNPEGF